ncbi:P-loop containing nucleoside triphosphate hydrolase protein, partial [Endogone sp. FLAS-F59071]
KDFYAKYKSLRRHKLREEATSNPSSSSSGPSLGEQLKEESATLRHALILFDDFRRKKTAALREKIIKDRAALPIHPFAATICETLRQHRVLLVAGDTGCGKSTQVPQFLMEGGFGRIACTQPRRIACYSLARRVGYETMNAYGSEIAYQVRFEGNKTNRTRILFLTEGLLLRQFASDPTLSMYDVIVVDEVHERHLMGDFLLGVLKRLLKERENLHVVLMSATINAEMFAGYFDAPAIQVPGKMYEVKVHYMPQGDDDKSLVDERLYQQRLAAEIKQSIPSRVERVNTEPYLKIMELIDQTIPAAERGDLLIFMSGINEISTLAEELKLYANHTKRWIVLMLHSSLSVEDQDKIFDIPPEGTRKCIVSSNISETSVTIDGIRFIIDSGRVKELTHEAHANLSKLSEFWISKASATQRAGRAGRTGPGVCYRLYSQREFNHLNDFPTPEILRAPLEPVVMQIKALELGNPREFDFVERPSTSAMDSSVRFLQTLGALDEPEEITSLGRVLAVLPVDAILGKMLIMSTIFDLIDPILTIAAAMSVQSPFVRLPTSANTEVAKNRRSFDSRHGDPFTFLNLWNAWLEAKSAGKESSRSWCKRHGVEEQRLYEMAKLKKQFEDVLNDFRPGVVTASKQRGGSQRKDDDRKRKEQKDLLRRERHLQQSSTKKRKVLKFDEIEDAEVPASSSTSAVDIRDLEFSLANDVDELRSRSAQAMSSSRDVALVKLIVCSGLYPQLAIGDEHNYYRNTKKFLSLHPSSVIFANPDWVQGTSGKERKDDITAEEDSDHELLCYLQLLETNKPYLVNIMRVPVDTNTDCSVLVIDDLYIIKFRTTPVAEHVLWITYKLRKMWNNLVEQSVRRGWAKQPYQRVKSSLNVEEEVRAKLPRAIRGILEDFERAEQLEDLALGNDKDDWLTAEAEKLAVKLADFLSTSISCLFRLAKASELLNMFPDTKPQSPRDPDEEQLPAAWDADMAVKHGLRVTHYLRYDSARTPSSAIRIPDPIDMNITGSSTRSYWYCTICDSTYAMTRAQFIKHVVECKPPEEAAEAMELGEEEGEGEGGADKSASGKIGGLESKRGGAELYFVREQDVSVTKGTEVGSAKARESEHLENNGADLADSFQRH